MPELPHSLHRDRHVDLVGRRGAPWVRRVVVLALTAVVVAALAGAFGQEEDSARSAVPAAVLRVRAPERVRGGLFFQGRIDVEATQRIRSPRVILGSGWSEGLQVNTIEPAPTSETARDGRLQLAYDALSRGQRLTVWLQFEVNPTTHGRRDRTVTLLDGDRVLTTIHRKLTVLP